MLARLPSASIISLFLVCNEIPKIFLNIISRKEKRNTTKLVLARNKVDSKKILYLRH